MTKFFEDKDYVPSDLVAGLILVEAKQKEATRQVNEDNVFAPNTQIMHLHDESRNFNLRAGNNLKQFREPVQVSRARTDTYLCTCCLWVRRHLLRVWRPKADMDLHEEYFRQRTSTTLISFG